MDQTTLEALEFPAVLKDLADRAATAVGNERLLALEPMKDAAAIDAVFKGYSEIDGIVKTVGRLPVGNAADIRPGLARLGPQGAYLLPEELQLIQTNIQTARELGVSLDPASRRLYPLAWGRIDGLSDNAQLGRLLDRILDNKGGLKDGASPELYRIRKEMRDNRQRARSVLEEVSSGKAYQEFVQDDFITVREDRYCLAIKAEKHSFVPGVIHGRSASGSTYFIEPIALVELNNRLAVLKRDEKAEEIAILKAAAVEVAIAAPGLLSDLDIFGWIDVNQARANFAVALNARVPLIKTEGQVKLLNARHPLLVLSGLKAAETLAPVIPINVILPQGCRALVISGANTGGKTVALKTLGLLTIMTLAGIPIPVDEGSEAVIFTSIFSDIGDRQDIIASLSTFSAHVKRIKEFLAKAGPGALVLIDEIGSGTDPAEGGAFALAVIERLMQQGATVIVTTHLNLIKAHAQTHPAFLNASVEFDETTMHPLYRLHYGAPGASLGLSIAEGLGIGPEVIESARAKVTDKEGAFMESVRRIEAEREELRLLRERLARQARLRDAALTRLRAGRETIRRKMTEKVDRLVAAAREEMAAAIEKARMEAGRRVAASPVKVIDDIGARLRAQLGKAQVVTNYRPAAGDKVTLIGTKTRGVVVRVDEGAKKAEVSVGKLKVWSPFDKLEKRGNNESGARLSTVQTTGMDMEASATLKLIGIRVEPALEELQKFLDSAHASGLNRVEIIHGLGTGALAKAVSEYLRACPLVERFYHGAPEHGGAGVTVAELK
ncbi:MAG: endonuclease MutS2 [Deltaproteobacteria bacterium]|nr:endonuclease MutS2 [Deltaproteobacteria bacterium]